MIIRKQQMVFLSQARTGNFEDRVAEHLNRCFPAECQAMGSKRVLELIRYGIERAATHGVNLERDVCKYIDLMLVFGHDFDGDPNTPWASRILEDSTLQN